MNRTIHIYLLLIFSNFIALHAQQIDFKSGNFKDRKDEYKVAEANLAAGDAFFKEALKAAEEGKDAASMYSKALGPYQKANDFNPSNAILNYKIGKAMFFAGKMTQSITFLEKAIRLDERDCEPDVYYLLGRAYKMNYQFDLAKEKLNLYKTKEKERVLSKVSETVNREILQCDLGKSMVKESNDRIWVEAVKEWNTEYNDYSPSMTADESMLIFNSNKPPGENNIDEVSVYLTEREKGKWSVPRPFGHPFEPAGLYEALAVSFDGQSIYLGKLGTNEDIYLSKLQGKTWAAPLRLPDKINSGSNESGACFSTDGIKIYYVSQQSYGNKGGKDLFFSGVMDRKLNLWGEGMTVGSEINTIFDDGHIYMHPDGKTLYFTSQGHNSMGGYDIFKTTRLAGRWSVPENLGYPVNTPFDETSFVLSASGKRAYITSNRNEGNKGGTDIYRITFLGPLKQPVPDYEDQLLADVAMPQRDALAAAVSVETKNLTILKGRVVDDFTNEPIGADIEIIDNIKNENLATFTSNSATGKFLVSLPAGFNYGIAVKAKDYLFHSENFNLPETSQYQMIDKEIRLKGACLGCKIILKNIFFDTGKFNLRPESTNELIRLANLIREISRVKPGIRIEISGHTDNIGSESSNQVLSENRAKSVVKYLTDQGIGQEKLVYKGYGSLQAVASNNTAEGRQENRRTEFKIIGE